MNYGMIKNCDIADGNGVRVSLFVSGCTHHCPGCFQPETWDFSYGETFDEGTERELLDLLRPDYINGLTLLGGEPMEPSNQIALLPFLRKMKNTYPSKDIWCYTGYVYEPDLTKGGMAYCQGTEEMLSLLDVLVDGPFIEAQKKLGLLFRGSENQRLIDMKKTLQAGKVVLYTQS